MLLAIPFAALWVWLGRRGREPSTPVKFALGIIQAGLGFGALVLGAQFADDAGRVAMIWLVLAYLLHTTGELCLSPIGLSMVTKLAAEKETGLAMGGWFLSIAMAQYVAGIIAAIASGGGAAHGAPIEGGLSQYADTYMLLFWIGIGFGAAYLLAAPLINKLMHGVK
jgi:POT family proton-dependent oligopeptide transporter